MKYFFGTVVLALIGFAYYTFVYNPLSAAAPSGSAELTLGEIPHQICPDKAWLLVTSLDQSTSVIDRLVPVRECRSISIRNYLPTVAGEYNMYVKLPKALAASAVVNTPFEQSITIPIRFGDITQDNNIDGSDEKLVIDQLYSLGGPTDVTGDGKVSIEDVVLVRLNKGVGAERADKKPWNRVQ